MTLTAVVTAHDASPGPIVRNLLAQTRKPDEILVFISAHKHALRLTGFDGLVQVFLVANKNDWGHQKRALGLELASGDFIGWFNHDDSYEPTYIEELLGAVEREDADVAFCNWSHGGRGMDVNHACEFRGGNSTAGNWIGRTALIREVGYTNRDYSADAHLIDAVRPKAKVVKVHKTLYNHNP